MTSKTIYLTAGTTWMVPSDWNDSDNLIECWGAGGGGSTDGAGGGGAYASISNQSFTADSIVTYSIGAGGTSGYAGGDTTFSTSMIAKGGNGWNSIPAGQGGLASASIGSVRYSGGDGSVSGLDPVGGGGNAASALGNGENGNITARAVNNSWLNEPDTATVSDTVGIGVGGAGGSISSYVDVERDVGDHGLIKITYTPMVIGYSSVYVTRYGIWSTAGDYGFTIPANATNIIVQVWGAGGAGGSASRFGANYYGGDGAASTFYVNGVAVISAYGGGGAKDGYYRGNAYYSGDSSRRGAGGSGFGPVGAIGYIGSVGSMPSSGTYARGGNSGGYGIITVGGGIYYQGNGGSGSAGQIAGGGGSGAYSAVDYGSDVQYFYGYPGGGGGFVQHNYGATLAGQYVTLHVGQGANYGGAVRGYDGANGAVVIQYNTLLPAIVTTPILMSDIANTFLAYGDAVPDKPWGLASYYAKEITGESYADSGGSLDTSVRNIRYGYGTVQNTGGIYTQKVPSSGMIGMGSFMDTYQKLSMRAPVKLEAAGGQYFPPGGLYAQHDIVNYTYTGYPQEFKVYNASIVKIECFGGDSYMYNNGTYYPNDIGTNYIGDTQGGYAVGTYVLAAGTSLWVYVGGSGYAGNEGLTGPGGWNGGGSSYDPVYGLASGGSGATDVRTTYNAQWYNGLNQRIIVAGGAGGWWFPFYRGGYYQTETIAGRTVYDYGWGGGANGWYNILRYVGNYGLRQLGTYGGQQSAGGLSVPGYGQNANGYGSFGAGDSGRVGVSGGYSTLVSSELLYSNNYQTWIDPNYAGVTGGEFTCGGGGGWWGGGAGFGGGGGSGNVDGVGGDGTTRFGITTRHYSAYDGLGGWKSKNFYGNGGLCKITILG